MRVAEGRQIACDEIQRFAPLGVDDLRGRNERSTRTVTGRRGRRYELDLEIFDDHDGLDEVDENLSVLLIVNVKGPRPLPINFREAVALDPDGEEIVSDLAARPRTIREELQDRTLAAGCLGLAIPLLIVLSPLLLVLYFGSDAEE